MLQNSKYVISLRFLQFIFSCTTAVANNKTKNAQMLYWTTRVISSHRTLHSVDDRSKFFFRYGNKTVFIIITVTDHLITSIAIFSTIKPAFTSNTSINFWLKNFWAFLISSNFLFTEKKTNKSDNDIVYNSLIPVLHNIVC